MHHPTLSNYRIDGELGAGGMGVVYSAHDLRLRRDVALKMLPPELAERSDRMDRFRREAQSLAALNHPNIVTIYAVEEENGTHFLTMERVRGRTLDRSIGDAGMPLRGFLDLAIQMADGMSAAEQAGITHRDLKPANVMVTEDGRVKIIDLGLAKLIASAEAKDSLAPTVEATVPGAVVGTPAYMSPEQIEGRPLDHRSDIFTLGVLFFEMLTGQRPFKGAQPMALMASILRDDPVPVSGLREGIPAELTRIVRRCLEKLPTERFQSALDLRNALKDVQAELSWHSSGSHIAPPRAAGISWAKAVPIALGLLLIAGLGISAFLQRSHSTDRERGGQGGEAGPAAKGSSSSLIPPLQPAQAHRWSSAEEVEKWPQMSPDGSQIAYAMEADGVYQVFLRPVDGGSARAITSGEADHIMPAWSRDGQKIAYVKAQPDRGGGTKRAKIDPSDIYGGFYIDGGDLWIARSDGTDAKLLVRDAFSPVFRKDGSLTFTRYSDQNLRIWTCDQNGGKLSAITPNEEKIFHVEPSWSPDETRLACRRQVSKYGSEITVFHPVTGDRQSLTPVGLYSEPVWSPDGHFIYFVSNPTGNGFNIWRLEVDEFGKRKGEMQQVTFGPGPDINPAFSPDGESLLFAVVPWNSDLWLLPVDPATGAPTAAAVPLITSTGEDSRISFSADERVVSFCSTRDGEMSIYAARFDPDAVTAGPPVRVTQGGFGGHYQPSISPDARDIAFFGRMDGNEDIYRISIGDDLQPVGTPVRLTDDAASEHSPFISPDGAHIAFRSDRSGGAELWVMSRDGTNARALTTSGGLGHFTPWYDASSVAVSTKDVRDVIPDAGSMLARVFIDSRELEVLGINSGGHMSLSPDRSLISDNDHKSIVVMEVRSMKRAAKEIMSFPDGTELDYTVWSPSGRWIAFDRNSVRGGDIYRLAGMTPGAN